MNKLKEMKGQVKGWFTNSYGDWIEECEQRIKRGERQSYCTVCRLWKWPSECEEHPKITMKAFKLLIKESEKYIKKKYPSEGQRYKIEASILRIRERH